MRILVLLIALLFACQPAFGYSEGGHHLIAEASVNRFLAKSEH